MATATTLAKNPAVVPERFLNDTRWARSFREWVRAKLLRQE
jgi:hypothetical protein